MTNIDCKNHELLPDNSIFNNTVNSNNSTNDSINNIDSNNILNNNLDNDLDNKDKLIDNNKKINLEYSNLQIKKFIDEFTEDQQIEIFKIIKYYDQYYSSNNNGIFINLDNLSFECKNDIIKFIKFSKQNDICLDKMEMDVDKYKQIIDDSNSENN